MRKKFFLLTTISMFLLSGCTFLDKVVAFFKPKENEQQEQQKEEEEEGGQQGGGEKVDYEEGTKIDFKQVGEFYGGVVQNEKYIGYEFSKSQEKINKPTSGLGEINVYAFNDFHGAVVESYSEAGLKAIGTFYKEKSQQKNTIILDQGDTWQGSFESNYQYGAIVQDVFNYAGVTLRTVGNHDFDWGLNHLESTNNRKIGDDYIPVLASNVYDYSNGKNGNIQQNQYGKEYAIFTLDNGIRVGIVGVIGEDQITSICSTMVSAVCFTDHVKKAKEMSDYLRTKKACDVIVVSAHESAEDMQNVGLGNVSSVSNKRYADLILGGHFHYEQRYTTGGAKCVQWDSNGETTGLVNLKYDFANNCVLDDQTKVNTYNAEYYRTYYSTTESTIAQMVDDYLATTEPIASEVLNTNFSGSFNNNRMAYLMTEAIFDAVKSAGYTVDFAVTNYARTGFYGDTFTYSDLYKCFPFDNQIILMDIESQTSINSLSRNMTYREDTTITATSAGHHKIAVIDYIGLHQNGDRQYDYFPDAYNVSVFNPENAENPPIYRDILKNYLKNNPTKNFNSSDYTTSNPHFSLD